MSKFVEYLLPLEYAVERDASAVTTTSYLVDVMPTAWPWTMYMLLCLKLAAFWLTAVHS
jgi:hypothetical protein